MAENLRVTSYVEISAELGKKLIKLYGEKIFPRQGKVFADMLFQTGIEAGTYIASLANIEERSVKIELATNAMVKLNQTAYLINVMKEADYYTAVQVVDIEEYMKSLLDAMHELLNNAFAQNKRDGNTKPNPTPMFAPLPYPAQPMPAPVPQPAVPVQAQIPVAPAQPQPVAPAQPVAQPQPAAPARDPDYIDPLSPFDDDPDGFLAPASEEDLK